MMTRAAAAGKSTFTFVTARVPHGVSDVDVDPHDIFDALMVVLISSEFRFWLI